METNWSQKLEEISAQLAPLGETFSDAGFELYFVGGIVRDAMLGAESDDIDLTTNAKPDQIRQLLAPNATAIWDQGERFGTIGGRVNSYDVEITTYRGESYKGDSRKPEVVFGETIDLDLSRRDFTINAMAVAVDSLELVDPFQGSLDLKQLALRTPLDPDQSFSDDPLRILRAGRFAARLGLDFDSALITAAAEKVDRLSVVSAERIQVEIDKLLNLPDPSKGVELFIRTGIISRLFPWLASEPEHLQKVVNALVESDKLEVRRAALFFYASNPIQELRSMKYSQAVAKATAEIIEVGSGLGEVLVAKPELRHAAHKYGQNIVALGIELGAFVESADSEICDRTAEVFADLIKSGEIDRLKPPITGQQVMERFDIAEGRAVGDALTKVQSYIFENGPIDEKTAWEVLDRDHSS